MREPAWTGQGLCAPVKEGKAISRLAREGGWWSDCYSTFLVGTGGGGRREKKSRDGEL